MPWQELQKLDSVDSADLTGTPLSLTPLVSVRILLPLESRKPRSLTSWLVAGSLSFAKSLRRHHKDFFPLDVSTSVLDGRLIRRPAKDARRKCEPCLVRVSTKESLVFRTIESTLPPHNDGAARRVSERIESCFHPQSEFLLHGLLACPSPVQDESGHHGSRAGRKTAVV